MPLGVAHVMTDSSLTHGLHSNSHPARSLSKISTWLLFTKLRWKVR